MRRRRGDGSPSLSGTCLATGAEGEGKADTRGASGADYNASIDGLGVDGLVGVCSPTSHAVDARAAPAGDGGELPCLFSNIGNETPTKRLSTQTRKAASALAWNVQHMAEKWGLERVGFLTLTFRDHVTDIREASRRFKSLSTGVLSDRYQAWMGVVERQKSGRIHYHLLVVMDSDIRTGFDFAGIARRDYSSVGPALRSEWAFWRKTAPAYSFGRTELMPVRSTEEGIGRYVGKYIGKHFDNRSDEDKGARLVRYSTGARMASTRFAFASQGALLWRLKVKAFAYMIAEAKAVPPTFGGLRLALGPRWAYNWREFILSLPSPESVGDAYFIAPRTQAQVA